MTDLFGSENSIPNVVVRLKKLETGKARLRTIIRTKLMARNAIAKAMADVGIRGLSNEGDKTVALLLHEEFNNRMHAIRDIYRAFFHGGTEAVDAVLRPETDPWANLTPETVAEMLDHEQVARQDLQAQLDGVREALAAKDRRIRDLEFQIAHQQSTPKANSPKKTASVRFAMDEPLRRAPPGSREEVQRLLLSQVKEAFQLGLKRDAAEARALRRHLEKVEACESLHLRAVRELHAEIRSESERILRTECDQHSQEVSALQAELERTRQKARLELSEHKASARGALELAEYYVQQHLESQHSEASAAARHR